MWLLRGDQFSPCTHSGCTQARAPNREKSSRHTYLSDPGPMSQREPLRDKLGAVSGEGLLYTRNAGSFYVRKEEGSMSVTRPFLW